jgi:hypothetical protein
VKKEKREAAMDWIKIEASEQSRNTFVKALYADTKNQTLSAPAKELVLKEVDV